jgi:hypothetical protein
MEPELLPTLKTSVSLSALFVYHFIGSTGRIYFSTRIQEPTVFSEEYGGNGNHFLDSGAVSCSQ